MLLSLLPVSATFASDRLLFFVGIGAMGLMAMFLQQVFEGPRIRWKRVIAGLFVLIHLVLSPLALSLRAAFPAGDSRAVDALYVRTDFDESIADQDLVIVNAPSAMHAHYVSILRSLHGEPAPKHTRVLAPAVPSITIHRPDERSLRIRPEAGYLKFPFDRLFRNADHPLTVGDRIELTGMQVEVTALTSDGRPAEALFVFDVPLEDPSLRWLRYEERQFVPFTPPAVGETVTLDAEWPW
jgi:hypothetical protein